MKTLYFDTSAGAAGDMIVASLLDLGVDPEGLRRRLETLPGVGFDFRVFEERRRGVRGLRFDVEVTEDLPEHRHLAEIRSIVAAADLPAPVCDRALAVFRRIAEAEGRVHGMNPELVHFHEVGAVDSIVDIVGACLALDEIGPDRVIVAPPRLGSGTVECRHGSFPVPSMATLEILRGVPVRQAEEEGERVTPTGAALLAEFADGFGPLPAGRIEKIGYGTGSREFERSPNILRAILCETQDSAAESDVVTVLETNIDDLQPELLAGVCDRLLAAGALDAYVIPAGMKKGRSGHLLGVIAPVERADELAGIVLRETTAFGVRLYEARRRKLAREIVRIDGPYGPVDVKVGRIAGEIVNASPEYDSVREAARRNGVPEKEVYRWAQAALPHGGTSRGQEEDGSK